MFAIRAGAQGYLYLDDQPTLLAAGKLLLGWPLTIVAAALTLAAIGRVARPRRGAAVI